MENMDLSKNVGWKLSFNGKPGTVESVEKIRIHYETKLKICPEYKKVSGTPFAVDAFEYGAIEGVTDYFLTHFHYDHYIGLHNSFDFPIYCSGITANLINQKIRVNERHIRILKSNESVIIRNIEVTSFDANHCPGSIMLLFRLPTGQQHLHTGDFRANAAMEKYSSLSSCSITNLYLDTTYCDEDYYVFPMQNEIVDMIKHIIREKSRMYPRALFVCGSDIIGQEEIFKNMIEELECKLWCDKFKSVALDCLHDEIISSAIVNKPTRAKVHLLQKCMIRPEALRNHIIRFNNSFSHIFAFQPTGWAMATCTNKQEWLNCSTVDNITIYGVPYSDHSSFSEICQFVKFLKPSKIIPTVNVESKRMHTILKRLIDSYKEESN